MSPIAHHTDHIGAQARLSDTPGLGREALRWASEGRVVGAYFGNPKDRHRNPYQGRTNHYDATQKQTAGALWWLESRQIPHVMGGNQLPTLLLAVRVSLG